MTGEALLLDLALKALDDADFLPVLGDAVLEQGWAHSGLEHLVGMSYPDQFTVKGKDWPSYRPDNSRSWEAKRDNGDRSAKPTKMWAAAIAVLILRWDTRPWFPVHRTLYGIDRTPDPYRLAGMRVETTPERYRR